MNQSPQTADLETGLLGGPEKREVNLHEYDNTWPTKFRIHADIIKDALGQVALLIEHIGSTSVPNLAAKPIIDILLVVRNSGNEALYLPALECAGYELRVREPDFDEHRMMRTAERDVHLHIFSSGSQEIDRYLIFRNRLRNSTHDRARYEALKRSLAKRDWVDINDYAKSKSQVVESIISAGRHERKDSR